MLIIAVIYLLTVCLTRHPCDPLTINDKRAAAFIMSLLTPACVSVITDKVVFCTEELQLTCTYINSNYLLPFIGQEARGSRARWIIR